MKYFSSNKIIQFLPLCFIIFYLSSCASNAKYITNSSQYTSYGIDYHDIEKMVDDNVKSFLKSDFIKDLTRENFGNKILAISDIQNATDENVDVELLSRKFVRKIRNSKKFTLTNAISGSGNTTDSMIKNSRKLRNDEEFNQLTTQQKNNLISPDYSLSGKISQRVTRIKKDLRIDYQFLLTLTDLKTGTVVWDNEEVIFKLVTRDEIEQMAEQEHIAKPYSYNKRQSSKTKYYPTTKNHFIFGVDFAFSAGIIHTPYYGWDWGINYFSGLDANGTSFNFPISLLIGYERDITESWALGAHIVYTQIALSSVDYGMGSTRVYTPTMSTDSVGELQSKRMGLEIVGIYKCKDEWDGLEFFSGLRLSRDFVETHQVTVLSNMGYYPYNVWSYEAIHKYYLMVRLGMVGYLSRRVGISIAINYENTSQKSKKPQRREFWDRNWIAL